MNGVGSFEMDTGWPRCLLTALGSAIAGECTDYSRDRVYDLATVDARRLSCYPISRVTLYASRHRQHSFDAIA